LIGIPIRQKQIVKNMGILWTQYLIIDKRKKREKGDLFKGDGLIFD